MESSSHGPLDGQAEHRLLQSVVAVARHVYGAAASSVFTVSPDTGELIFAAVAGAGEQSLVGRRFPAGTGIAGWVAATGQTMIAEDVAEIDQFARDAATSTGYLPSSMMAAPLLVDGQCIGVLEVLDAHAADLHERDRELDDMELLGLLATQAALSLSLLRRRENGPAAVPAIGALLARLSEYADEGAGDPLAAQLLGVSLELLDRTAAVPLSI